MRLIEHLREQDAIRSEFLRRRIERAAGPGARVRVERIPKPKRPVLDREHWRESWS